MAPKQSKSRSHAPAVSDPRFSRAQNDPRFLRPKKETFQAVLDDRFKDLLTPGAGGTQHAGKSKVDKYGRKIRGDAVSADAQQLRTLYRLEGQRKDEDEEDDEDDEDDDDEDEDEDEDDDDEEEEGEPQAGPTLDYARGEGQLLSSSDDDSDSSADDDLPSEDDYSSVDEDDLRASTADQQQARASGSSSSKELRGDRTRRIAVVNMDWDHIRARDLYMVFSSLVSPTATHLPASADAIANAAASASGGKRVIGQALQVKGRVVSVRVYPSEFGRERMKKEDVEGPPRDIFKSADDMASSSQSRKNKSKKKRRRKGGDDEDDDEDEEEEITAKTIVQVDEGGDFDEEALRKYQLERLRYYYAVAEFDSVESASHVYNEIDGTEMERSANVFDLRFVPDEMSFPTYPLQADEPGQEDGWRDEVTFEDSANGGLTTTATTTTTSSTTAASSSTTGKYRPLDFKTDALRHSRVKLTWDADDPERTRITKNVFAPGSKGKKNKGKKGANANVLTLDEMRDDDFRAYLASATEDEAEEGEEGGAGGEEGRARFRALLNLDGGVGNGDASDSDEDGKEAKTRPKSALAAATAASSVWGRSRMPNAGGRPGQVEGEMEITFTPGLSEAKGRKESKLKLNKKGLVEAEGKGEGEGEESTLDKYKRKQREKKERKLAQRAVESTGDGVDDGKEKEVVEEEEEAAGGLGFDDPFFTNDGDVERAMAAALDAHDRGASESAVAGSAKAVVAPTSAPTNKSATVGTKSKTQSKREAKLERKRKRKAKGTSADDKDDGDVDGDDRDDDDDDGAAGANFDVDVSDPRFGALMEDHRFALDPSHKAWKETKGMRKLVDERRKKARRS